MVRIARSYRNIRAGQMVPMARDYDSAFVQQEEVQVEQELQMDHLAPPKLWEHWSSESRWSTDLRNQSRKAWLFVKRIPMALKGNSTSAMTSGSSWNLMVPTAWY